MTRALLLDLDDTMIVEEPAAVAAFAATARGRPSASPSTRASWHSTPARARASLDARRGLRVRPPHRDQLVEALWCRYEGDDDELRALREWAPGSAATPGAPR